MIVPRRVAIVAIIVGTGLVGGIAFLTTDVLPGLSLEALAGLLPDWAITAEVSHTVAALTAKTKPADVGTIVAALDRLAASNGLVRDDDTAMMVQAPDPDHLRISYSSPRAFLSFHTEPGKARLAIESAPGRNDDLTSFVGEVQSVLSPLGFTMQREP